MITKNMFDNDPVGTEYIYDTIDGVFSGRMLLGDILTKVSSTSDYPIEFFNRGTDDSDYFKPFNVLLESLVHKGYARVYEKATVVESKMCTCYTPIIESRTVHIFQARGDGFKFCTTCRKERK